MFMDPRSTFGALLRGNNVYPGGTNNATRSGNMVATRFNNNRRSQTTPAAPRTPVGQSASSSRTGPISSRPKTNRFTSIGRQSGRTNQNVTPVQSSAPYAGNTPAPAYTPPTGYYGRGTGTVDPQPLAPAPPPGSVRPTPVNNPGPGTPMATTPGGDPQAAINAIQSALGGIQDVNAPAPITIDALLEAARANADASRGNLDAQGNRAQSQIDAQLAALMDRLGLQRTEAIDDVQQMMAANGIFRSGINTQAQGDVNRRFNSAGESAAMQSASALENLRNQLSQGHLNINNQLNTAEGQFATRAEEVNAQNAAIAAQANAGNQQARNQLSQHLQSYMSGQTNDHLPPGWSPPPGATPAFETNLGLPPAVIDTPGVNFDPLTPPEVDISQFSAGSAPRRGGFGMGATLSRGQGDEEYYNGLMRRIQAGQAAGNGGIYNNMENNMRYHGLRR